MADITIQGLEDAILERIRKRAGSNHRSLEEEIKDILTWGVEYIERIQTLTVGMEPMKMPKPFDYAAQDESLKEARAFREHIRKEHEEYEQGTPEREAEEKEWEAEKQKLESQNRQWEAEKKQREENMRKWSDEPPSPEPTIEKV